MRHEIPALSACSPSAGSLTPRPRPPRREQPEVHEPRRVSVLAATIPGDPAAVRRHRERALTGFHLARPEGQLLRLGLRNRGRRSGSCDRGGTPPRRRPLRLRRSRRRRGRGRAGRAAPDGRSARRDERRLLCRRARMRGTAAGDRADARDAVAHGREPGHGRELAADGHPEPERRHAAPWTGFASMTVAHHCRASIARFAGPRASTQTQTRADPARKRVASRARAVSSPRSAAPRQVQRTPPWPIAPLAGWLTVAPNVNVRQPRQRTTPERTTVVPFAPSRAVAVTREPAGSTAEAVADPASPPSDTASVATRTAGNALGRRG